jgi:hypothetical protein
MTAIFRSFAGVHKRQGASRALQDGGLPDERLYGVSRMHQRKGRGCD